MWQPPDRIRHPLLDTTWPTADTAATSLLFSPIDVGPTTLEQRTWVPAMVPWRSNEEGQMTDDVLDWYGRFAEGRPGAIVVEATGIRDIPSGPLLRISHDRYIDGLKTLVERVREASKGHTKLFIQIIDFLSIRRRPPVEKYFRKYFPVTDEHREKIGQQGLSDDDIREHLISLPDQDLDAILNERELEALRFGYREWVTDVHLPNIATLPEVLPGLFADAAGRAEAAGFDGVELHYAHAYTMASFLSKRNTRGDGYGGSKENRIRLPLDVFNAVRKTTSDTFTIGCRYLSEEIITGGTPLDESIYFGVEFAKAGLDYLSLSRGGKFEDAKQPKVGWASYPYTGPSGYECMPTVFSDKQGPFGRNISATGAIRKAVRDAGYDTPIVVAGGIATFEQAESILKNGEADIIAAARQSIADPDWFRKVHLGRGDDIRRCVFTNYCEALDQKHKQVTCQLWSRVDLDAPNVTMANDGKRRLIAPPWTP